MKRSKETKKSLTLKRLFLSLSILANTVPILVFVIIGFINGEPRQKFTLGLTILVAVMFGILSIINKHFMRSIIFIILIGLYYTLNKLLPVILVFGLCTVLDEIVLTPLYRKYRNEAQTNKIIDRRM